MSRGPVTMGNTSSGWAYGGRNASAGIEHYESLFGQRAAGAVPRPMMSAMGHHTQPEVKLMAPAMEGLTPAQGVGPATSLPIEPEAHVGLLKLIGVVVQEQLAGLGAFYYAIAPPWYTEDKNFVMIEKEYGGQLPVQAPHLSRPPLITARTRYRYASMQRFNLGTRLEMGFLNTPAGQMDLVHRLRAIQNMVRISTFRMIISVALSGAAYWYANIMGWKAGVQADSAAMFFARARSDFGAGSEREQGFQHILSHVRRVMADAQVTPRMAVVPPGAIQQIRTVDPAGRHFYKSGDALAVNNLVPGSAGEMSIQYGSEFTVHENLRFDVSYEGERLVDNLITNTQIGGHHYLMNTYRGISRAKKYTPDVMVTQVYSMPRDDWHPVTFKEAIENCGLFDEKGEVRKDLQSNHMFKVANREGQLLVAEIIGELVYGVQRDLFDGYLPDAVASALHTAGASRVMAPMLPVQANGPAVETDAEARAYATQLALAVTGRVSAVKRSGNVYRLTRKLFGNQSDWLINAWATDNDQVAAEEVPAGEEDVAPATSFVGAEMAGEEWRRRRQMPPPPRRRTALVPPSFAPTEGQVGVAGRPTGTPEDVPGRATAAPVVPAARARRTTEPHARRAPAAAGAALGGAGRPTGPAATSSTVAAVGTSRLGNNFMAALGVVRMSATPATDTNSNTFGDNAMPALGDTDMATLATRIRADTYDAAQGSIAAAFLADAPDANLAIAIGELAKLQIARFLLNSSSEAALAVAGTDSRVAYMAQAVRGVLTTKTTTVEVMDTVIGAVASSMAVVRGGTVTGLNKSIASVLVMLGYIYYMGILATGNATLIAHADTTPYVAAALYAAVQFNSGNFATSPTYSVQTRGVYKNVIQLLATGDLSLSAAAASAADDMDAADMRGPSLVSSGAPAGVAHTVMYTPAEADELIDLTEEYLEYMILHIGVTLDDFVSMWQHGLIPPIGFVLHRPFREYRMGGVLICDPGGDYMRLAFSEPNILMQGAADNMTVFVHYAAEWAALLRDAKRGCVVPNVFGMGYVCGEDAGFFSPNDGDPKSIQHQLRAPVCDVSIITRAVPYAAQPADIPNPFFMSGGAPEGVWHRMQAPRTGHQHRAESELMQIETTNEVWKLRHINTPVASYYDANPATSNARTEFSMLSNNEDAHNEATWQDAQLNWSHNTGEWSVKLDSTAWWRRTFRGCRKFRELESGAQGVETPMPVTMQSASGVPSAGF